MTPTRRSFMRQVGVSLAALLASGCVPSISKPTPTCYTPPATTFSDPCRTKRPLGRFACLLAGSG